MNYLDIIIIIPLLWAVYRGFTKGLIITAAGLAALILGIYGAIYFSGFAMSFLIKYIDKDPETLRIISFAVTFIIIVLLVHLVARLVDSLIRAVALGFVNRLAGVVFNGLKMAFILSIIIGILNFFDPHSELVSRKDKHESFLYPPVAAIAPLIFPYFRVEHFHLPAPEKKTNTVIKET